MLSLIAVAAEEAAHSDPALSPIAVGAIALGILLILLFITIAFGAGREHS